ncbi:hypothetical protein [Pedobacter antarcticus]|uniref:phosphoribosyltransferase-like protein n=1 Tax=Pedobacter antarcticus TaxID=34086 RepID=UPI0029311697|nr:hypothetical protein [Pedobacter antarcticus]
MRIALAETLLIKIMKWDDETIIVERPFIQAMANFKYDEYQQFSPGIRFIESMSQWLSQFTDSERAIAYKYVKENLIFISNEQMAHLVNICFAEKINPILLKKAAAVMDIPTYHVKSLHNSDSYKEIKRRSLFLGISDGAKIDQLRRSSGINNEQVFSSYYIAEEKKEDMLKELKDEGYEGKFNSVYLIDDFTGSGLSYARLEDGKMTGKLIKFLKLIFNIDGAGDEKSVLSELINTQQLDFHIIFYIAREHSLNYLIEQIEKWKLENDLEFSFTVDAIQKIGDGFKDEVKSNFELLKLSKTYITEAIIDRHFKKGKHDDYYLGFDECALPLILNHNTPNNSLPLLWWYPEDEQFRGLFPRVTRHKE